METILLVEDSKFLRIVTERALTKAGYQVICAGDGEEAVALATAKLPNLVVLDIPNSAAPRSCKDSKPTPPRLTSLSSFSPASCRKTKTNSSRKAPLHFSKKAPSSTTPASYSMPSKQP
jgi:DNA-binding NarL/FixJ family response regulator